MVDVRKDALPLHWIGSIATWVKRLSSVASDLPEWQTNPLNGTLHIPRQARERALNEGAVMECIARTTNILIPKLHCSFEDDRVVLRIHTQFTLQSHGRPFRPSKC